MRVVVPDSLDLITPYVLREQQDWFEDELKFLRVALEPGQNVVDIGANYGVYALTIARVVGPAGRVFAYEPASATADFLARSIAANGYANVTLERCALSNRAGIAHLAVHGHAELNALVRGASAGPTEMVPVDTLDAQIAARGSPTIDFVKIDAEGEEAAIIEGGARFFRESSPLVQYEIKAGNAVNTRLVDAFGALGYRAYRLVPGLNVLAPLETDTPPDAFLLNAFGCKADRAGRLAARDNLVESAEAAKPTAAHGWRETVAKQPYAAALAESWAQTVAQGMSGDVEHALALHALSRDPAYSMPQRVWALRESMKLLRDLCEDEPTHMRLASLARVAREQGARALAVNALAQLHEGMTSNRRADVTEPFLAPSHRFDAIDPRGAIGNWMMAAVLESIEELSSYSSFYTGAAARERLEAIATLSFGSPAMARRRDLVNARFHV